MVGADARTFRLAVGQVTRAVRHRPADETGAGDDLPTLAVPSGEIGLVEALVGLGLVASKGEARRLIAGGGARVDGEKAEDEAASIAVSGQVRISAGKKKHGLLVR